MALDVADRRLSRRLKVPASRDLGALTTPLPYQPVAILVVSTKPVFGQQTR